MRLQVQYDVAVPDVLLVAGLLQSLSGAYRSCTSCGVGPTFAARMEVVVLSSRPLGSPDAPLGAEGDHYKVFYRHPVWRSKRSCVCFQ